MIYYRIEREIAGLVNLLSALKGEAYGCKALLWLINFVRYVMIPIMF
jgi:hypothetical protein